MYNVFFKVDNVDNVDMGGGVKAQISRLKQFDRRRRPKCDARKARLTQKAQKWGLERRRREIFWDIRVYSGIF